MFLLTLMKILYGVCGEGFGHSSRADIIIKHLIESGDEVLIVTYGQAYEVLKKYGALNVPGLRMVFEEGKLAKRKTIVRNLREFFGEHKVFLNLKKKVEKNFMFSKK